MSIFSKWFSNNTSQTVEAQNSNQPSVSAADYCEKGEKSLAAGRFVEAMEYFQAAIETDKRFEKAYLLLATSYEKQGAIDKAKASLYGLLAIDPNNNNALQQLNRIMGNSEPNETKASIAIEPATMPKQQYIENTEQNAGGSKQSDNSKLSSKTITVDGVDFEMVFVEGSSFYYGALIGRLNQKTKYNFRLPTQTEWEYAARGGKFDHGYKYPGHSVLKEVAWSWSEGMETHEVGKKRPNELGLYDMLGNVSELCDGGFLRGGGDKPVIDWYLHDLDRRRNLSYIKLWRITAWTKAFLPKGDPYIGFRLAMNDWSYEGHSVIS